MHFLCQIIQTDQIVRIGHNLTLHFTLIPICNKTNMQMHLCAKSKSYESAPIAHCILLSLRFAIAVKCNVRFCQFGRLGRFGRFCTKTAFAFYFNCKSQFNKMQCAILADFDDLGGFGDKVHNGFVALGAPNYKLYFQRLERTRCV